MVADLFTTTLTKERVMSTFVRHYTAKQLNRGEGMTYHPASGKQLSDLAYVKSKERFCHYIELTRLWFDLDDRYECIWQERIGTGRKEHFPGDPFPKHWQFDPWTGKKLNDDEAKRRVTSNGVKSRKTTSQVWSGMWE